MSLLMFLSLLMLLLHDHHHPNSLSRFLQKQWCVGNYTTITAVACWKLRHSNLFSEIVSIGTNELELGKNLNLPVVVTLAMDMDLALYIHMACFFPIHWFHNQRKLLTKPTFQIDFKFHPPCC